MSEFKILPQDRPSLCCRCSVVLHPEDSTLTVEWNQLLFLYCPECRIKMTAAELPKHMDGAPVITAPREQIIPNIKIPGGCS
jgi:hypothetical protein